MAFVLMGRRGRWTKKHFSSTFNIKVLELSCHLVPFYYVHDNPPFLCATAWDTGTPHTQSSAPLCFFYSEKWYFLSFWTCRGCFHSRIVPDTCSIRWDAYKCCMDWIWLHCTFESAPKYKHRAVKKAALNRKGGMKKKTWIFIRVGLKK